MKKITVIVAAGLLLGACSLIKQGAWQGSRPAEKTGVPESRPTAVVTSGPTETLDELDQEISADLDASLDAEFDSIEADLNSIDKELQGY